MIEKVTETDVLIIGGGVAGTYAALEAIRHGAQVLLITKGLLGKSCCSVEAQMFLCPPQYTPPDNLEKHLKQRVSSYGGYVINQENERNALISASEFMHQLEELGLYWRRYPDGEFVRMERNTIASKHGDTGKNIIEILASEFQRKKIPLLEDTAATRLLTKGRSIIGAMAINYASGEIIALRAKSVIIAAGPGGWLWTYSTAPQSITGDGLIMAYRAGAELTNIEFNLWHMSDHVRVPGRKLSRASFRQNIGPSLTPRDDKSMWAPVWLDSKGRRFMEEWEKSLGGLKHEQAMAVISQIRKGKATKTSGIYASLKHVSAEDLEKYLSLWPWLKKIGIDTTKDLLEVGMCAHWMIGGIEVSTKFETTLPGLYAAGGVTSGATSLAECLYSGRTAARHASEFAKTTESLPLDRQQIMEEKERILSFLQMEPRNGFSPAQIKRRIREIMWEKMHYLKNEKNMKQALHMLHQVRKDVVPRMRLESDTKRFNYAHVEALDVMNMLDLAELIVKISLIRKESRKQFQREDYPETDNKNWLKNIVVKNEEGHMKIDLKPVRLSYVKPDED